MSISIAIVVHNEEQNILRTLESIYDWVDEIVIVDGNSTDKTVEIIKKQDTRNKIQIISEKNPPMFHINKQKAIEKCTGEWILQLDADEIVSPELKEEIIQVTSTKYQVTRNKQITNSKSPNTNYDIRDTKYVAYWIPRLNYFLGKPLRKGGQYPDYTIRLYRNGVARFPCKDVHEQVEIITNNQLPITKQVQNNKSQKNENLDIENSLKIENSKIGHLKAPLLHFPYKTFADYLTKWIRYCELEADILYKKNIKPTWKNFFLYILVYPDAWFIRTFIRNRGYVDGFPGFIFSLFSALRYRVIYTMLAERYINAKSLPM